MARPKRRVKQGRNGYDPENATLFNTQKRQEFLDHLRQTSNVSLSSEAVGISKPLVYIVRAKDPEFAAAMAKALDEGIDVLEDEAKRRATGYDDELVYQGKKTGETVKKYSDLLLLALLNAHRPEKYRPKQVLQPAIDADDAKRITEARDVLAKLSTDELASIATVMSKATERAVAQAVQPNGKRTLQ